MNEKEVKALLAPLEKRLEAAEKLNAEQETVIATLQKEVERLNPRVYDTLEEIKAEQPWAYEVAADLLERGVIKGDQYGKLGFTVSDLRQLVIADRIGDSEAE